MKGINIYDKKQQWKLILFLAAIFIVGMSLWYSNIIIRKIAREERTKIQLWAGAIQKKANLVKYTNELFNRLRNEERKKVELWAKATRKLASETDQVNDLSFLLEIISNNETVPVILTDDQDNILSFRNLDSAIINDPLKIREELHLMKQFQPPIEIEILDSKKNYLYYKNSRLFSDLKKVMDDLISSFISEIVINSASVPVLFMDETKTQILDYGNIERTTIENAKKLQSLIQSMEEKDNIIEVELSNGNKNFIYYEDSYLLKQLKLFPFIQLGIIGIFLLVAYSLFSTARKAEQNQVWVGMAKETAHQLGTPLSSLMAWLEYLKSKGIEDEILSEINKDIKRLETITERFSKIGSVPLLVKADLQNVLKDAILYMSPRVSQKVSFELTGDLHLQVPLNIPLFEWVIENILRNSVDAMEGNGKILFELIDQNQFIYLDITDTGKGIPKSKFKTVFEPGYTSKQRGWGLGLSLAKRIIENYHKGKIFIRRSEIDKGTTFRIVLNK